MKSFASSLSSSALGALVVLALSTASQAQPFIASGQAHYRGIDKVHLSYATTGGDYTTQLSLKRNGTVLRTVSGESFSGNFNDTNLPPGDYTYKIHRTYEIGKDVYTEEHTIFSSSVTGATATGELLFDDTIADLTAAPDAAIVVSVPAGRSLTLINSNFATGSLSGTGHLTLGDVNLSAVTVAATLPNINFAGPVRGGVLNFAQPYTLSFFDGSHLKFAAGSDGSTVTGCPNLVLEATGCSVSAAGCANLSLRVGQGAELNITGGSIIGCAQIFPESGGSANMTVRNAKWDIPGAATIPEAPSRWLESSTVVLGDCEILGKWFSPDLPPSTDYIDCVFRGQVGVFQSPPYFNGCEFAKEVYLVDRVVTSIGRCTFHHPLILTDYYALRGISPSPLGQPLWTQAHADTPNIASNFFLGESALIYQHSMGLPPAAPIPIGANYYGEASGPLTGTALVPFLKSVGSKVRLDNGATPPVPYFTLAPHLTDGFRPDDHRVFPAFWKAGLITGQITLDHSGTNPTPNLQGKETFLSVHIDTSAKRVEGVKLRVEFDGRPVTKTAVSKQKPVVVFGSLADSMAKTGFGHATFDYVLPVVTKPFANLRVWLDTREVAGFKDAATLGAETLIHDGNLSFAAPYARPLRIHVLPLWLVGYGAPADPVGFARRTREVFEAMLPLRAADIEISVAPASFPYFPLGTRVLFPPLAAAIKSSGALQGTFDMTFGTTVAPDFTIALLPNGFLGEGVDGMNLRGFREILFVEERAPNAGIHEMGHGGPGLYLNPEQYDMPAYKDVGMPIEGLTAFINVPPPYTAANDQNWANMSERFHHYKAPGYGWNTGISGVDIMGASNYKYWMHPTTLAPFYNWLRTTLGTAPPPTTTAIAANEKLSWQTSSGTGTAAALAAKAPRDYRIPAADGGLVFQPRDAPGPRRIFITCETVKHPNHSRHMPDLGTVRAFEVYGHASAQAAPAVTYPDYEVVISDAQGAVLATRGFNLHDPSDRSVWQATIDTTSAAARIVMRDRRDTTVVYFDQPVAGGLTTQLTAPAAGTTLGNSCTVRWQSAPQSVHGLRGQALQHLLMASLDGGATWQPASVQCEGDELTLSTLQWPATPALSLRLLTSDGLQTVESRVDGLILPDRPPVVAIQQPANGQQAPPDSGWYLSATAHDADEVLTDPGTWTSSLDGTLGTGPVLDSLVLSAGTHVLTYMAEDSASQSGSASVTVEVTTDIVPLAIPSDALAIAIPSRDGLEQVWAPLAPGSVHRADLGVPLPQSGGWARASLYLTPPGAAEIPLGTAAIEFAPGEILPLTAAFTPETPGNYQFRATLERGTPDDPQAPDPVITWTLEDTQTWQRSTVDASTLHIETVGSGTVTIAYPATLCATPHEQSVARGTVVHLLATPAPGWVFDRWDGAPQANGNSARFIMGAATEITARFVAGSTPAPASLTVSLPSGTPGASLMEWRLFGQGTWLAANQTLASLTPGIYLIEFRNIAAHASAPPALVELAAGQALAYIHEVDAFVIETTAVPATGLTLTGAGEAQPGQTVVLTATPASGFVFHGWTEGGLLVSTDPTLTFTADRHRSLAARVYQPIDSVDDLALIGRDPAHPANAAYRLTRSLDLAPVPGVAGFEPIPRFCGYFDGQGHALHRLTLQTPRDSNALFSNNLGTIANLRLYDGTIWGGSRVGALAGENEGIIENCLASAQIRCFSGSEAVGGLVGHNLGTIRRCSAQASVSGVLAVGGLVGRQSAGLIEDSYATGAVAGSPWSSYHNPGGLLGSVAGGEVRRCYATGACVYGLLGYSWSAGATTASFWDTTTSGTTASAGGTGLATAAMKQRATYESAGWDFTNIWMIADGADYPVHRWPPAAGLEAHINLASNPSEGGTTRGHGWYPVGAAYEISAHPAASYLFSGWSDGDTSNPRTLQLTAAGISLTANFTVGATLAITSVPPTGGSTTGAGTYPLNSPVQIEAIPTPGWRFTGWRENDTRFSTSPNYLLTLTYGRTFTAHFEEIVEPPVGTAAWSALASGTNAGQGAVWFTDAATGWVATAEASIRHTTNGGQTWSEYPTGVLDYFQQIHFADAQNGWVTGVMGNVLRTSDGGQTWTVRTPASGGNWNAVRTLAPNGACLAGGRLARTTDGGQTWTETTLPANHRAQSLWFHSPLIGWAAGGDDNLLQGAIWNTTNGGQTWTLTSTATAPLRAIHFADALNGWAVSINSEIIRTLNGGTTWTTLTPVPEGMFNALWFTTATDGWLIGRWQGEAFGATYAGQGPFGILKTTNGGQTWLPDLSPAATGQWLNAVCFPTAQAGFAVGDEGIVLKYQGTTQPPASPYDIWAAAEFSAAERLANLHLPHADPGGHGIPNLLRYGFGLGSHNPDRSLLPVFGAPEGDPALIWLNYSVPEPAPAGVALTVQRSATLGSWENLDWSGLTIAYDHVIAGRRYRMLGIPLAAPQPATLYHRMAVQSTP